MMSWFTVFFIILAVLSLSTIADDPCRFANVDHGVIDLTSLGRMGGMAAYQDETPTGKSDYSMLIFTLIFVNEYVL